MTNTTSHAPEAAPSPWDDHAVPQPAGTNGRPGWFALAVVLFTGPSVWAVHLVGGIALVPAACSHGATWAINVLTVACSLLIAGSMWLAVRILQRHRPAGPEPDSVIVFVALVGLLWGSISLLVTVLEGIPNLVLNACPV